jgi:hypothetical protein
MSQCKNGSGEWNLVGQTGDTSCQGRVQSAKRCAIHLERPAWLGESKTCSMFLAQGIIGSRRIKQDGRSADFGIPYRSHVGTKTAFSGFIMENRAFDSLGEHLCSSDWIPRCSDGIVRS